MSMGPFEALAQINVLCSQNEGDLTLGGVTYATMRTSSVREILALVRPNEGIVLSPQEVQLAQVALREYGAEPYTLDYSNTDAMEALAKRLEDSM